MFFICLIMKGSDSLIPRDHFTIHLLNTQLAIFKTIFQSNFRPLYQLNPNSYGSLEQLVHCWVRLVANHRLTSGLIKPFKLDADI